MTYPPQPGGYGPPNPHGQHPGYGQQPPYGQPGYGQPPYSGPPADPVTGVPQSPGPYGQPTSSGQPPYGPPAYGPPPYGPPGGFPPPTPPPPAGERPGKVTTAVICMLVIALLWVIMSVASIIATNVTSENFVRLCGNDAQCLADAEAEYAGGMNSSNFIGFFLLVGFLVVVIFTIQGHTWARIVAFILNGLSIASNACVGVFGVLTYTVLSLAERQMQQENPSNSIDEILPGWILPVTIAGAVITLILNIIAIILLANKESGAWFKAKDAERRGRIG